MNEPRAPRESASAISLVSPMQLNPILVREVRARWRGRRAFSVLLVYAGLFALAVGLLYANHVAGKTSDALEVTRFAQVGHELFMALAGMQVFGWTLLAPALAATSIAGERENGMLDLLQMSPLPAFRIIGGKLASVLWFCGLLMLAPLPVVALCFLMGGVSPGEFGAVLALQFGTALCGAAVGLCCSAWCRRAGTATGLAFGLVFAWLVGSFFAMILTFSGGTLWSTVGALLTLCNPVIAVLSITDVSLANQLQGTMPFAGNMPPWIVCLIFESFTTLILLTSAVRAVRRPLQEPFEKSDKKGKSEEETDSTDSAARSVSRVWRELPLLAQFQCSNPMLQREVRRKLRWRQPSPLVMGLALLSVFVLGIGYIWLLIWGLKLSGLNGGRIMVFVMITLLGTITVIATAGALGATSFTRERESQTWQAIQLSLLTPGEIIWGKFWPSFTAGLAPALLLWTLALPCINAWEVPSYRAYQSIALTQTIAIGCIYVVTIWCYTWWGLYVSWRCRQSWIAITMTLASLIGVLIFLPIILMVATDGATSVIQDFLRFWHPFFAIVTVLDSSGNGNPISLVDATLGLALPLSLTGCLLVGWLHRDMKRQQERSLRRG